MDWNQLLESPEVVRLIRVLLIALAGLFLLFVVSMAVGRLLRNLPSTHTAALIKKLVFYIGVVAIMMSILLELGFNLSGFLATAGIATVAIGFAAQTSLSNLISGLFLIGEKPFRIGDLIRVDNMQGVVESIDLLSIKIRTLDNLFIRVPNESMIKNPVTTVTRFPIRRMDIDIGVAYKEDVRKVMDVLREVAAENPFALDDPEPLILFNNFGDSALQFRFGLWFEKSNFLALRNSIMRDIKERFDKEGIEIPFPHLTVYRGSATDPFPVEISRTHEKKRS